MGRVPGKGGKGGSRRGSGVRQKRKMLEGGGGHLKYKIRQHEERPREMENDKNGEPRTYLTYWEVSLEGVGRLKRGA